MNQCMKADFSDNDDIVDFINLVFSYAHRPHDFKTLLPKAYRRTDRVLGAEHYLVKQENRIKALVANRKITSSVNGYEIKTGLIGNVSVHPYSRGNGYMKDLMNFAVGEAKKESLDLLALGGQRQRYGYFGFENAGTQLAFCISKDNIRHCFSDIDCSCFSFRDLKGTDETTVAKLNSLYRSRPFYTVRDLGEFEDILHSWDADCRVVLKNGQIAGYCYGALSEIVLENDNDYLAVIKAFFEEIGISQTVIPLFPFETERIRKLSAICESYSVRPIEMICVLNWKNVLQAFLSLKSTYTCLQDGAESFCIDGQYIRIEVSKGVPTVSAIMPDEMARKMNHNQAENFFFGLQSCLLTSESLSNWTPLPYCLDLPDTF